MRLKKKMKDYYHNEVQNLEVPELPIEFEYKVNNQQRIAKTEFKIQFEFYTAVVLSFCILVFASMIYASPLTIHLNKMSDRSNFNNIYNDSVKKIIVYMEKTKLF
jgi:hypothetical protein